VTTRGRPRLVSPAMLAEAASELFLEQGYHHTSVDDIANRAGVARATFFNYFPAKADVLFWDIDDALTTVEKLVASGMEPLSAITAHADTIAHSDRPLIATQADTMAVMDDVWRVGPARVERLRKIIASQFPDSFTHWQVTAAVVSAALSWATDSDGGKTLSGAIHESLLRVSHTLEQSL
jgi:AcrR family transcriptional regulator